MPVSPQDFALWSRMTGNPYPQTPAERMALAPHVYEFNRQIGRQGGPTMGPVRRAVDVAGKVALGAGLVAGAGYLASKGFQKLQLDNEPEIIPTVVEEVPNYDSAVARNSGDITPPPTSDNYNQDVVAHQTSGVQSLRGTTPQKPTLGPIEQKTATQSEVIGSQQHFSPGNEEQQLASSAQPNPSIRDQAEELIGRVSASKLAKFRQSPSYEATVRPLDDEELIGDTTPYVEPPPKPAVISGPVRMTPQTRVAVEESPISEMVTVATPKTVTSPSPAATVVSAQRKTSEQMEDERLARMAFGNMPMEQATALLAAARAQKGSATVGSPSEATGPIVTTRQPQQVRVSAEAPVSEVKQKLFQKAAARPAATIPGTEEHLVAEALEQREGMREPPAGTQVFDFPRGGTRQVKLYPNQQVGIVHSNDPHTEYGYKSSPEYYGELESMLKSGQFTPGGTGFIQAGRNLGYLY